MPKTNNTPSFPQVNSNLGLNPYVHSPSKLVMITLPRVCEPYLHGRKKRDRSSLVKRSIHACLGPLPENFRGGGSLPCPSEQVHFPTPVPEMVQLQLTIQILAMLLRLFLLKRRGQNPEKKYIYISPF